MSWRAFYLVPAVGSLLVAAACGTEKTDCNDGLDNDGDGLVDSADPGCDLNDNVTETPDPVFPQCSDGEDNDGDGFIDGDDPGCTNADDDDEYNEPLPAQCADGIDNDGDTRIDFPNDPGCGLALEDDESDDCPDGPDCPACSDGMDNDGDDKADYPSDPGCGSAADVDEFNSTPGVCGPSVDIVPLPADGIAMGSHEGMVPNELQSTPCGGRGGETVYTMAVSEPSSLFVSTDFPETTLDTVIYVRSECRAPDTEVGCNDDAVGKSKVSTLLIPRVEPGTYYIVIDAFGPGSIGDFKLQVETFAAEGESCDPAADPPDCPPGLVCRLELPDSPGPTCVRPECDDGNDNDGDGFSDYPNDPGCSNTEDNDEGDLCPGDASCPQCGNEVDDDGDTFIDYPADPGCLSASDNIELDECLPGIEVLEIPGGMVTGNTATGSMSFTASCDSDSSMSPEKIHGFRVNRELVSLTFSTAGSTFANTLYVRAGMCDVGPDVACAANTDGRLAQTVTIPTPTIDTNYFVFVDGDWSTSGAYTLTVTGRIPAGDPCEPGDTMFVCEAGYACDPTGETCVTALCNDGMDNDGDTLTDWPNDPGCASTSDNDESDMCPGGASCPECGNDTDDDGDLLTDYPADPGCNSAADDNEIDECIPGFEVLELDPETGATGVTAGTSMFFGSCSSSSSSPEHVYSLRIDRALTRITYSTVGSTMDTVTYVRLDACDDTTTELACADPGAGGELVTINAPAMGTHFIFVDGNFSTGSYVLNVDAEIPGGDPCDPASTAFRCEDGYLCHAGTMTCQPTQCNDGTDNDGDMKVDAFDAGCTSVLDDSESPDPAPLPQCADGMDNDGDTFTDYDSDPGCSRASDNLELDCEETDPIVEISLPVTTGTTAGKVHDFTPSCSASSTAPDVVHTIQFPGTLTSFHADTGGSGYDTVLYVKRDGCDGADLGCNDDAIGLQSQVDLTSVAAGTLFIFVDGFSTGAGAYSLNVSGVIAAMQPCDPDQVTAGIFSCASGTCQDLGTGFKCQ